MADPARNKALMVGADPGLSAALARELELSEVAVALATRRVDKLAGLAEETGARASRATRPKRRTSSGCLPMSRQRSARSTSSSTTPAPAPAGASRRSMRATPGRR
ncbi:hypothetical protein [Sphingomonas sp. PAMC 26605]|uniref:hypothetical protein n=1 Tax=Sphingomonas sp. PAMC 26605 TaxID=1112214 RepID=UPI00026CD21C